MFSNSRAGLLAIGSVHLPVSSGKRTGEGSLIYDSGNDGLGVQIDVSRVWGRADADARSRLRDRSGVEYHGASIPYADGARLNSEITYGLRMGQKTCKPRSYADFEMAEGGINSLPMRNRVAVNRKIDAELERVESRGASGPAIREVKLNGSIK